ncbi:MAG: TonB-dependent receptor family protein [Bacteroidales bacterium]|nr:TonB-dependent receptor family protein [Bacteroidales bacterium]
MKRLMFFVVALVSLCCVEVEALADETNPQVGTRAKGTYFRATILDSLTREPIEFATLHAKYVGDQQPRKYALSDSAGVVVLQGLPVGRATITFEYMGYKGKKFTFDIKKGANEYGELLVSEDNQMLDAVVVSGIANQMLIKKDTIEYNASSYKIEDTDMLEELIKKLPGVEIDESGNITANGKTINKVMIDGKEFFLDDPNLATKNIPAKIVEKVRVVERKSEQAQFTGIDDGDEETVLDLGIKAGMMQGWFGNLSGGLGNPLAGGDSDMKYEGAAMIGRFTDKTQISIIANGNNTNNRGFTDMAGSMMGGMRGGGGWMGRGVTTSWMGGVNANTNLRQENSDLQGNLMYSGSDRLIEETKDRTTMLSADKNLYSHESGYDKTYSDGIRFGGEWDMKLSDKVSFLLRPNINIGRGDYESFNEFNTRTNADSTNRGYSRDYGDNHNERLGGMMLWRFKFNRPGRTMSLNVNYNYSNNESDGYNYSETGYFRNNVVDSTAIIDQNVLKQEKSNNISTRLSYIEPLGKNFFVEGTYRYSYKKTNSDKETYSKDAAGNYSLFDQEYSTSYENTFITQQAELNFMKQEEKYNITIGASMQPSTTKSVGEGRDTSYTVTNFSPSARIDYRFSDDKFLRVRYRGRTSQPSINQLMPVNDNSDPLKITVGNEDLKPKFTHSISAEYRSNDRAKFSFFSASADFSYTKDDIVSKKYYTEDGVQVSTYENTDKSVYSASGRIMYNVPIKKSGFSINTFTMVRYNNGINYMADGQTNGRTNWVENETQNLNISEMLRLTYRNDWAEIIVGGRVNYRNAWYTVSSMKDVSTWTNSINGSVNFTIPGGVNLISDINHTFYEGFDEGYDKPITVWNAAISKNLFKNSATLKFKVYDILKQSKNTSITTTENYVQNVTNNTLGQYFMVTLTWRFGNFGDMRNGGARMGGPGRGMGGPMGGRPGGPMGGPGRR